MAKHAIITALAGQPTPNLASFVDALKVPARLVPCRAVPCRACLRLGMGGLPAFGAGEAGAGWVEV